MRPHAVLLAAGGGRRMGGTKGLLELDGEPLVCHHVQALASVAGGVVVVVGSEAERVRSVLPETVAVVDNPDWEHTGPADSLARAVRQQGLTGPCLVSPVDVPPATPATLRALLHAQAPVVPVNTDGRRGHPVLLDAALVRRLHHEIPEHGLRTWLGSACLVPVDQDDIARDFDDPASWGRWLQRRG